MRIIAVLGEREDFSFLGMLKRFLEGNGIKTECIWAGAEREYVKETIFSKKPDVLIIFSEESLYQARCRNWQYHLSSRSRQSVHREVIPCAFWTRSFYCEDLLQLCYYSDSSIS